MSQDTKPLQILCVDDSPQVAEVMSEFITALGYEALLAGSATEAMAALAAHHLDITLVITDLSMPGTGGLDFRRDAYQAYPDIPFVVVSGYVTRELALQGIDLKVAAFIEKPPDPDALKKVIEREAERRAAAIRERRILEATFLAEAWSIVEEIEPLILNLEHVPGDLETINAIFRLVHTLKGSGGAVGFGTVARFCHAYEELLGLLKMRSVRVDGTMVSLLLKGLDFVKRFLGGAENGEDLSRLLDDAIDAIAIDGGAGLPPPPPPTPQAEAGAPAPPQPKAVKSHAQETIKVSTDTLDEFMELSGEITVIRNMVNKLVRSIEKSHPGDKDVGVLVDLLDEMHKVNGRMQAKVIDLRKVPMQFVYRSLPRTLRDLSRALNKDIQLVTQGEALRVDTAIIHTLSESMIHLIRNAADHGLEPTADRVALGKGPQGTISVNAAQEADEIVVTIQDNGRGIDAERVKAKALDNKLVTRESLAQMSRQQVLSLIFESGFSTAAAVSDISGRGVGLDMVRSSVERVHGRIDIASEMGVGTTFSLRLPVPKSVVIISALLVGAAGEIFAVPQDAIVRLLCIEPEERSRWIATMGGGEVLRCDGRLVALVRLATVLDLDAKADPRACTAEEALNVIHVRCEHGEYALIVDRILDGEDIVVKAAGAHINSLKVFAGVTFLGDRSIGLILDPDGLRKRAGVVQDGESTRGHASHDERTGQGVGEPNQLVFHLRTPGLYSIALQGVFRLEEFHRDQMKDAGGSRVIVYRDMIVPIFDLDDLMGFHPTEEVVARESYPAFVLKSGERLIAFLVKDIVDVVSVTGPCDPSLGDGRAALGHVFVGDQALAVLSPTELLRLAGVPEEPSEPLPRPALEAQRPDLPKLELNKEPLPQVAKATTEEGWGLFD